MDKLDYVIPLPNLKYDKDALMEILHDPKYGNFDAPEHTHNGRLISGIQVLADSKWFADFAGYHRKWHPEFKNLEPIKSIIKQLNGNMQLLYMSDEYAPALFSKFPPNVVIGRHKDSNRTGAIHIPLTENDSPTLFYKGDKLVYSYDHDGPCMMNIMEHSHGMKNDGKTRYTFQIATYHPWEMMREWYNDSRLILN